MDAQTATHNLDGASRLRPAHPVVETYGEDTPNCLAVAVRRAVDASTSRRALLRSGLAAQISGLHSFDNYVAGLTTAGQLSRTSGRGRWGSGVDAP